MEIKACYDEYKSTFLDEEGWLPSDAENEDDVKIAYDKINLFLEKSLILLTRSVISGEYIKTPNINNILSDFIDEVTVFEIDPRTGDRSVDNLVKLRHEFDVLNSSLFNALRFYQLFISTSKNKFIPTPISDQYGVFKVANKVKGNALSLFVDITIPLCQYDYFLPVGREKFQNILSIRNSLKELIGNGGSADIRKIYSLLLFKCHFIIQRVKQTPFDNEINFNRETITPSRLDIGDYKSFVHEETKTKDQLLDDIKSSSPKMKSFIFLMKHYQQNIENEGNVSKMDYVINRYTEVYTIFSNLLFKNSDEFITQYDQFSLDSILNFLHNCQFSFYTKQCSPDLRCIKQELRKIEDVQNITKVKNFHPYKKAIKTILACIRVHLGTNDFDERLIGDKLDELERLIYLFESAIKWSEFHKFFPFQLPFEESLVHSEEYALDLFVPSAFAKHVDYKTLKEELNSFKKERENLSFLLDLSKERKEIEKIKESIKTSDKKAIDLIAIFTASITFLFGVVNIFVVNNSLSLGQLISNTMGLGIILALFMCIYLLISPVLIQRIDKKTFFTSGRFVFGVLGVFIYFIALISVTLNPTSQDSNKVQSEKQSIKNEVKSDTVIHSYNSVIKSNK